MTRILCSLLFNLAFCTSQLLSATQHIELRDFSPKPLTSELSPYVDKASATIGGPADAAVVIQKAIDTNYFGGDRVRHWTTEDIKTASFYCILHVLLWDDSNPQKVSKQNTYLYRGGKGWAQDDFATNKRIFGAKNIAVLYLHLHKDVTVAYKVEYDLDVTSKVPANILHLFEAAAAFTRSAEGAPNVHNIIGITDANISYVPSDISFTPNTFTDQSGPKPLGDPVVFDNEGKYWWDASVAVPIRKMSEAKFNSTDNTVTANSPDKRTVFAVLDLYPFKKDVKSTAFDWHPYGLAGVGVGQQPLHRILIAGGWGPRFAQFYAGVLLQKQQSLSGLMVGSTATPAQLASNTKMKFQSQFSFGVNLTVRDVFKANTGSSKQSSATTQSKSVTTSGANSTPAVKTPGDLITVTPQSLDFGTLGTSQIPKQLVIANKSGQTITMTFGLDDLGQVSVPDSDLNSCKTLDPDKSCTMTLTLRPGGNPPSTLHIIVNNGQATPNVAITWKQ